MDTQEKIKTLKKIHDELPKYAFIEQAKSLAANLDTLLDFFHDCEIQNNRIVNYNQYYNAKVALKDNLNKIQPSDFFANMANLREYLEGLDMSPFSVLSKKINNMKTLLNEISNEYNEYLKNSSDTNLKKLHKTAYNFSRHYERLMYSLRIISCDLK